MVLSPMPRVGFEKTRADPGETPNRPAPAPDVPPPRGTVRGDHTARPLAWFKADVDWPRNAKLMGAGWRAIPVWFALLGLNARNQWRGRIPATWASVERVAAVMALVSMPPEDVRAGLAGLFECELLEEEDGGSWKVVGWSDNEWGRPPVPCSRCKKGNPEPAYRACPACRTRDRLRKREEQSDG